MSDTNIILCLKDGREVEVIYPNRVFTEFETPWLDKPGCLQTSDPVRDLAKFVSGQDFTHGGRFVIGRWIPSYNKSDRIDTILMARVAGIIPANAEATARGNKVRQEEDEARQDEAYPDQVITRRRLAELFPSMAKEILTRPRSS